MTTPTIETMQSQIEQLANQVSGLTALLLCRDSEIQNADQQIAQHEGHIRNLTKTIANRDDTISQLTKRAEATEADCVVLRGSLSQYGSHADDCNPFGKEGCRCGLFDARNHGTGQNLLTRLKSLEERNKELEAELHQWERTGISASERVLRTLKREDIYTDAVATDGCKASTEGGAR